jgi:hypothetical protein
MVFLVAACVGLLLVAVVLAGFGALPAVLIVIGAVGLIVVIVQIAKALFTSHHG